MTTAEKSSVASKFNMTVSDVEAALSAPAGDPCKKWKDAFVAAAALWLDSVSGYPSEMS